MTTAELLNETTGEETRHAQMQENHGHEPLFDQNETTDLRNRWQNIQTSFVDEPQSTVKQADELVASTIKRLAEIFANERTRLEKEWSQGDQVSTEDLRQALRRYRSFFDRLLSV